MNQIIKSLKAGHELKPMQNAGSFFADGMVLTHTKNGLTGFSEVMESTVIDLERRGIIFFNPYKGRYVLTKKGEKA